MGPLVRHFRPWGEHCTVLGTQFYLGPRINGIISFHALAGINFLKIGGKEQETVSGNSVKIIYYGSGGTSDLWAKMMNQMNGSSKGVTYPKVEAFRRTALGLNFGISLDLAPVRFTIEYLPVFDDKIRNDFRVGMGFFF